MQWTCLLGFEIHLASSLSTAFLFIIFVSSRNQLRFKASRQLSCNKIMWQHVPLVITRDQGEQFQLVFADDVERVK